MDFGQTDRWADLMIDRATEITKSSRELVQKEETSRNRVVLLKKVESALAVLTERVYRSAALSLEPLLNYGLRAVYSREIKASIVQEIVSGRPTFEVRILDGGESVSISQAHGGGLAQIVGFLIRIVLILLTGKRRLLILDESFSAVSRDLQPALSALLKAVTNDLGFQIILITHSMDLASSADLCYLVDPVGKISIQES